MQTSTQQCSYDMVDRLTDLRYQSELLRSWCTLPSSSDIDANHTLAWSPCGAVQYITMQMQNVIQWEVKVNSEFVIDIYFQVFYIDVSGELCLHSALIVYGNGKYASPIFCGRRKPWSELVNYHVAIIEAEQINVIQQMQLAFTYSILDPIDMRELVLRSKANTITMRDQPRQSLTYEDMDRHQYRQMWYLKAPFGKVIAVTSSTLDVFNHLSIFEGFGRHHPANDGLHWNMEAKLINYYVVTIYLYNGMIYGSDNLHSLTFWHLNLTPQLLLPSSILVLNAGGIYYKRFSIKTKHGSFPNVSFHVQRFDGWNEGGCTYGGFLFKQFLNDSQLEPQTLGPYCTDTEPNHPLTGTDGLDYLVFGDSTVDLLIYANGPLYMIDMEVVVSESSCVGVVSPIWLCSFSKNETSAKYFMKFPSYSVICELAGTTKTRQVVISFLHISHCVIIQSIGNETTEAFLFEVIAHIHFRLTMKLKKNVLLPHQHTIFSNWIVIYKQDNKRAVPVLLNKTTVLSRQHISSVTYKTTPLYKMIYYTYSLYVAPRDTNFSCVDTQMTTHKMPESLGIHADMQYIVQLQHFCGAGVYKNKGNYFFWFTVRSITPQIMYLRVIPSLCQSSNHTHDVLVACPDNPSCYALDLMDHVFHLYSTIMKTTYRYERVSLCPTFTIEYIFVGYNIIATIFPHDFKTIYVRIFTNHTQLFVYVSLGCISLL